MIILFYSDECKFSSRLLEYIKNNNLTDFFKLVNIDLLDSIPENINIVPTIIDSNIEAPLDGKKAFEYVINHKFFNYPTNNVDFWVNSPIPKPTIEEDNKALDKSKLTFFATLDDDNKVSNTSNITNNKPSTKVSNFSSNNKLLLINRNNTINRNKIVQNLTTDSKISNNIDVDIDKVKINDNTDKVKINDNNITENKPQMVINKRTLALLKLRR
jgi:hypothetical protein